MAKNKDKPAAGRTEASNWRWSVVSLANNRTERGSAGSQF